MPAAAQIEARGRIEAIIGPIKPSDKLKAILPRIARMVGITPRRAQALWSGEAKRIESHEMDRLRVEARRAEHLRTATQLDGAAHALLALDYEANRSEAASLRAAADRYRNLARGEGTA
jgi:hypothetical protein